MSEFRYGQKVSSVKMVFDDRFTVKVSVGSFGYRHGPLVPQILSTRAAFKIAPLENLGHT